MLSVTLKSMSGEGEARLLPGLVGGGLIGFRGCSTQSSQRGATTDVSKENKAKPAKGRAKSGGTSFRDSSPSGAAKDTLYSSSINCDPRCECCPPEKSIRDLASRFLLEAGHIGTLCLACTKMPDSQKEGGCSVNHTVCTNSVGTVSHAGHLGKGLYQYREH